VARIDERANLTIGSAIIGLPKDVTRWFAGDDFIVEVDDGIGENVPVVLDSDGDGDVDPEDVHVTNVDDGGTPDDPSDDLYVTDLSQLVVAEDEAGIYTFTGGIAFGKSVGVGASVSFNQIDRDVKAIVGEPVFAPSTAVDSNGVANLGYEHRLETGDAVVYSNGGGTSIGGLTEGQEYYVIVLDPTKIQLAESKQDAINGLAIQGLDASVADGEFHSLHGIGSGSMGSEGEALVAAVSNGVVGSGSLAAAVTTKPSKEKEAEGEKAPQDAGEFGVAISGDVSWNTITDTTEAYISHANITQEGDLQLSAENDTLIVGASGAAAISTSGNKYSAGLAGAFARNKLDDVTRAFVNHSTLEITGNLTIDARTDGDLKVVTASGAGASKGPGVAGSVSWNEIHNETLAYIGDGTNIVVTEDMALTAEDTSKVIAVAGAVAYGGKLAGVGSSVTVNNVDARTEAFLSSSDIDADGSLTLMAKSDPEIVGVAGTLGGHFSRRGMAAAVSVTVNDIKTGTRAYIEKTNNGQGVDVAGDILIDAMDVSTIEADSGSLAASVAKRTAIAAGAAAAVNEIENEVGAFIDGSTVTSEGNIGLTASSDADITALTIGIGGALAASKYGSDSFAGAGSGSGNTVANTIEARITGESMVETTEGGAITLSATDTSNINADAGGVAIAIGLGGGGTSIAVGASVAVNDICNMVRAAIEDSTATSSGSVGLTAETTSTIEGWTIGGAASVAGGKSSGLALSGAGAGRSGLVGSWGRIGQHRQDYDRSRYQERQHGDDHRERSRQADGHGRLPNLRGCGRICCCPSMGFPGLGVRYFGGGFYRRQRN